MSQNKKDKSTSLSHDENRQKVCAVCTNLWGNRAVRKVSDQEEKLIQEKILSVYSPANIFFPSGICKRCIHHLRMLGKGEVVELKLPDNYFCQLERQTRSGAEGVCNCRWCGLARLYGAAFLAWQREMKGKVTKKVVRLCQDCFVGIENGSRHICSVSSLEAVRNLTRSLDKNLQEKLALEILQQRRVGEVTTGGSSQTVLLPQARGGKPVPVQVGAGTAPPQPKLSHHELLTMASSAHLTGKQITTIAADLRVKLGRDSVQTGFDAAVVQHNNMYADYFTGDRKLFWDKDGNIIEKAVFWCHSVKSFLELVARKRGKELSECSLKIGGDTGKGFLKVTASIFSPNLSPQQENTKKKRRTREDGICGGLRFRETGQRMILLLCLVKDVPESMDNLEIIFTLVNLTGLKFTITGDFKLLMPWFGLLGCGSVHPCLYCNMERRKGVWVAKEGTVVELRTFGAIEANTAGWIGSGSKRTTAWTSKFESCVGVVTVWGEGDTPETTVLEKCAPPTVHSLLALNSVLRPHMEKIWVGDLWSFLKEEVNVVPHSYQGKDGAFEGPQCNRILNSVEEKLKPHLLAAGEPGKLYYEFLVEFKRFKDTFFGNVLPVNYRDVALNFKNKLKLLNTTLGFPITPKLHMMSEHVLDWVDKFGRALGDESEQAVEALHSIFDALWDSFLVKDDTSDIYLVHGLKATLKFNADQTNSVYDTNILSEE